jgi:hypothetical protein
MIIHTFCHLFYIWVMPSSTLSIGPLGCKEHWIVMGWLIISKLNATCLAIKTVTSLLLWEDLRTLHYSYMHSIMTDDIIYTTYIWGNWEYSAMLLVFCRIYHNMYIWYNFLWLHYIYITTSSISYGLSWPCMD